MRGTGAKAHDLIMSFDSNLLILKCQILASSHHRQYSVIQIKSTWIIPAQGPIALLKVVWQSSAGILPPLHPEALKLGGGGNCTSECL